MRNLLCFLNQFLNTIDIERIAKHDKQLKRYFLGAYPADITPEKIVYPSCWIWNTDEQDEPGQHWIAVWVTHEKMYFFDSFAFKPTYYNRQYWSDLAKKLKLKFVVVRKKALQSKKTVTCGNWALLYLYTKANKSSMLTNDKRKLNNDIKLKKIMDKRFGDVVNKIYDEKCKKNKIEGGQRACCFDKSKFK